MAAYLTKLGHAMAEEVKSFEVQFARMPWNNCNENLDCAIFLMKHMELFKGEVFAAPNLKQVCNFLYAMLL